MWNNIGKVKENRGYMDLLPADSRHITNPIEVPLNESITINADCHSTTKGLFSGNGHISIYLIESLLISELTYIITHYFSFQEFCYLLFLQLGL
jgi:hypothetical protein